jgi:hypothetical protein
MEELPVGVPWKEVLRREKYWMHRLLDEGHRLVDRKTGRQASRSRCGSAGPRRLTEVLRAA